MTDEKKVLFPVEMTKIDAKCKEAGKSLTESVIEMLDFTCNEYFKNDPIAQMQLGIRLLNAICACTTARLEHYHGIKSTTGVQTGIGIYEHMIDIMNKTSEIVAMREKNEGSVH